MRYLYVRKSRNFDTDAYIKKAFVKALANNDIDGCNYYELLIFDRKLMDEEVRDLEFEYIGEYSYEF